MRKTLLSGLMLGILFWGSSLAFAKPQSLGVFRIEGFAVPEALTISISKLIRSQIAASGKYSIPTQDEMEIIIKHLVRQKEIDPNCNTDDCNIEIADAIGLEKMILGILIKEENHYYIKLRLMDTITPSTLNLVLMKSTLEEDDLINSLQEAVRILLKLPKQEEEVIEELQVGKGALIIESIPTGATLSLDKKDIGMTPVLLEDLAAGKHELVVKRSKYLPWNESIILENDQVLRVKAELEDDWRKLLITSVPSNADTYINSRFKGRTPLVVRDLDLGNYRIRIDKRGFTTLETRIAIANERNNRLVVNLSPGVSEQELWEKEELVLIKRSEIEKRKKSKNLYHVRRKRKKLMVNLSKTMVRIENFWIDRFPYPNMVGEIPETNINWYEAKRRCQEESKRLCTNEEWDKACQGPFNFASPFSANYNKPKCKLEYGFLPEEIRIGTDAECVSEYGVYDMSGNLWEWTDGGNYTTALLPTPGFRKEVIATWLWYYTFSGTRCSNRGEYSPRNYLGAFGFRCCKNAEKE